MLLQDVLAVPVGDLARLADQRRVDQVVARRLLVQVLQAQQEGAMAESEDGITNTRGEGVGN